MNALPAAEDLPELGSMEAWLGASAQRRRAVAGAVAQRSGLELELAARRGTHPTLWHRPSGMRMHIVPGGVLRMGFSDEEAAALGAAGFLDTAPGRAFLEGGGLPALHTLLATSRPTRVIVLRPFLVAHTPMPQAMVRALAPEAGSAPAALAAVGLRLPSEAEWEHALRAGTSTPFYWGDEVPVALDPGSQSHPLGLALVGWCDELMADEWSPDLSQLPGDGAALTGLGAELRVVRGGGGADRPGCDETLPPEVWCLLSARRRMLDARDAAAAEAVWLRPTLSLDLAPAEVPPVPRLPRREGRPNLALGVRARVAAVARAEPGSGAALVALVGGSGIWTEQGALACEAALDLALAPHAKACSELLRVAVELVTGRHVEVVATGLGETGEDAARRLRAADSAPARRMRAACELRALDIGALTRASDPAVAASAALLVGMLPELGRVAWDDLAEALAEMPEEGARASLMLALATTQRALRRSERLPWLSAALGDASPLAQGAASLAQLIVDARQAMEGDGATLSAEHGERLERFMALGAVAPHVLPWHHGALDRLCVRVMAAHLPRGEEQAARLLGRAARRTAEVGALLSDGC